MPPRPKFEKQEVLDAALKIVRESGEEALTARRLADELGCSTRPIFTLFQGMQDVKEQLYPVVGDFFVEFCNRYRDYMPPFKGFGIALVDFASTEPHLFC
ncbi:MAG: TetR/AcrR family transcriptional regulator, partial [Eggerthellales bacterium]|nr:TetR/AcrR family transcriptional regulator [Eggerthellales bacterium]